MLPYGASIEFRGLSLNAGARLAAAPPRPKTRWVAYGDSITQGFRASDVAHSYPFIVGQTKEWQVVNMGFGSRRATAADGKVLGGLQADIFTVAMGFNDFNNSKPLADYKTDLQGVLAGIRAAQPKVPVYFLTPLWSSRGPKDGRELEEYRKIVREVAAEAKDLNTRVIEGLALIPNEAKYFTDGIHPGDEGFSLMATELAKQLKLSP